MQRDAPRTSTGADGSLTVAVSDALVALHKEHFGRGPRKARTHFAGPDTLICVLEDALLPAERAMVAMGEQQRVREQRLFLQAATQDQFVRALEEIVRRKVTSFGSATDPDQNLVFEVCTFESRDGERDGAHAVIAAASGGT